MECLIIKDGEELKADLDDLFQILEEYKPTLQFILSLIRKEYENTFPFPMAHFAFLKDETKEIVYRNLPSWYINELKQQISEAEARNDEDYTQRRKIELIDFIGNIFQRDIFYSIENIIWQETEEERRQKKRLSPLEHIEKRIEKALDTGHLDMERITEIIPSSKKDKNFGGFYRNVNVSHDEIQKAFINYQNDLQKIRSLSIEKKYLPAAALLFETGKIEELTISGKEEDEWPSFLEKCHALTELTLQHTGSEFPSWIRNATSLREFSISRTNILAIPDWIGDFQSLTDLKLSVNENLTTLPDSIGNLKNLIRLNICYSPIKEIPDSIGNLRNLQILTLRDLLIENIPDWIGNLQSLTELDLSENENITILPNSIGELKNLVELHIGSLFYISKVSLIKTLPDSMGNLKNLQKLTIEKSLIENIPDSIGNLQSLTEIDLSGNKNLTVLPNSIGNLKNMVKLNISDSPIEGLPDTIVNCTALKNVNIGGTKITLFPDFFLSLEDFKYNKKIEEISLGRSISYRCFCNAYYQIVKLLLQFNEKARHEGLLALEDELEFFTDDFIKLGLRMVVDGNDYEVIRQILTIRMEREHDYYRKKLMKVSIEGILCIQNASNSIIMTNLLSSLVNIKNNPIHAACAKYFTDDSDAINNIDFDAAIIAEDEREEIRFIKRVMELSELTRREGFLVMEDRLDREGIARRDVFEYSLPFVIDGWKEDKLVKILDNLIEHEADPVQKNLAQAKKEAVLSIAGGDNTRIILEKLCAYFDEEIEKEIRKAYSDD